LNATCGAFVRELNAAARGEARGAIQLSVADMLFGQRGYELLPSFLTRTAPTMALRSSSWTSIRRRGQPASDQHLGAEADTREDPRADSSSRDRSRRALGAANATYFKDSWVAPFAERRTRQARFHAIAKKLTRARMMNNTADYKFMEEAGRLSVLEMPYTGGSSRCSSCFPPAWMA